MRTTSERPFGGRPDREDRRRREAVSAGDRTEPPPCPVAGTGCSCHALALNSKHQMRSKKLSVLGFGQAEVQEAAAAAGQHGRSVPGPDSIADM